jgi:precorrin-2 dehydrogenase/sirohydrochlorin ferrochelatase
LGYYPAFLDLRGRLAALVGGGEVAARKLASLLEAGARVRLVAPRLSPKARELAARQGVEYRPRPFEAGDLEGAWLAVCATDDEQVNRMVAAEAEARGIFVNVVDVPSLCSFIVPASLNRGELTLAVSTGGAAPAVARRLRERLEEMFSPAWGPYLLLMRRVRARVTDQGRPAEQNRPIFFALADSDLLPLLERGNLAGVEARLRNILGPDFGLAQLGLEPGDLTPEKEATS